LLIFIACAQINQALARTSASLPEQQRCSTHLLFGSIKGIHLKRKGKTGMRIQNSDANRMAKE